MTTQTKPAPAQAETTSAVGALEKAAPDPTPPVITTAEQYYAAVNRWRGHCHLLTPFAKFTGLAPQHGLIAVQVYVDHDPDHGEVYVDKLFCKTGHKDPLDDEVAIAKIGLRRVAVAGSWNLDADIVSQDRDCYVLKGRVEFLGLNGTWQKLTALLRYDLNAGSELIRNMTAKQIAAARAHGLRHADARARNAACREAGLKQKYTRRELLKPFVIVQTLFMPNMDDPNQVRFVMERALQSTTTLYPSAPPKALDVQQASQETPVGQGRTFDMVPPAEATEAAPASPAIPEGMVLIQEIKIEQKKRKDGTGAFAKWTVIDSDGQAYVTIKVKEFGETLDQCWKAKRPLEIVSEENAYHELEITSVIPGPDPNQPSLLEQEGAI